MDDPIFLVGAARSGALLLQLMLDAHPDVTWGGDFDYALEWQEAEHAEWPALIPYWRQLAFSPRVRELRLLIDPTLAFPELALSLLAQQRARAGTRLFGVTIHEHYDRLLRLWPHARFVYLGCGIPLGVDDEPLALRCAERLWRRIAGEIPMRRRLEIRYESLVAFPRLELERACRFLEVPYHESMLTRPVVVRSADGSWAAAAHEPAPRAEGGASEWSVRRIGGERISASRWIARSLRQRVARATSQLLGE